MSGAYPHFKASYTHEELVEHFLGTPADLELIFTCRADANRCGIALLLKALDYLGYVPDNLEQVPPEVGGAGAGAVLDSRIEGGGWDGFRGCIGKHDQCHGWVVASLGSG